MKKKTFFGRRYRQRKHAIERCKDRYGYILSLEEYIKLCDRIWIYLNWPINKKLKNRGVFQIFERRFIIYNDSIPFAVAWDNHTTQISTFLTMNNKYLQKLEELKRV